ncbi:fumarylacetoacetate hydrolase family protein [Actinophytocola oryzae]|uniref:2-keto-4-pentenoate hydratase/2-oxohepta-3-ene-1,7-dioic acid hydratase in catechol pathway n=1 Tax=Actinophytocola oryzae TaxID=502181 RepID=A0A4R7W5I7_9PSEU|nr:fumarylacetoacetate hydrolase family protein [Actinophytocola oryzae]TDV57842.1 2-keto-4-pentenoate hydratase/2-oxohepta-3-ene-1,7-dioic acid hydratase in catechol pathway [Actinophytocola oryzae]
MKLCVVDVDGVAHGAVVRDGRVLAIPGATGDDPLLALLAEGVTVAEVARRLGDAPTDLGDVADAALLTPLRRPSKIIAVGLNYREHSAEFGQAVPERPILFMKYPSSVTGPGAEITVPDGLSTQVDFEVELTVVVGRACGPASPGGLDDIFGYTIANDVTARDIQEVEAQWSRSKSFDGFCPLGPVLTTADEVGDPQTLDISLRLNDEVMQQGNTAEMVFSVEYLMRWITATSTLEPGDLILTGTPSGVGFKRTPPVYLGDGDEMAAAIGGLGVLRNTMRFGALASAGVR